MALGTKGAALYAFLDANKFIHLVTENGGSAYLWLAQNGTNTVCNGVVHDYIYIHLPQAWPKCGQITIPYINGTVIISCIVFAYTYQKCCFWSSLVLHSRCLSKRKVNKLMIIRNEYVLWARIKNPLKIGGWKMAYFHGQAVSFRVPGWHSPYLQVVLSLYMLFEQKTSCK